MSSCFFLSLAARNFAALAEIDEVILRRDLRFLVIFRLVVLRLLGSFRLRLVLVGIPEVYQNLDPDIW